MVYVALIWGNFISQHTNPTLREVLSYKKNTMGQGVKKEKVRNTPEDTLARTNQCNTHNCQPGVMAQSSTLFSHCVTEHITGK